jgi:hypothetical protein
MPYESSGLTFGIKAKKGEVFFDIGKTGPYKNGG